jgi:hypothetical protein
MLVKIVSRGQGRLPKKGLSTLAGPPGYTFGYWQLKHKSWASVHTCFTATCMYSLSLLLQPASLPHPQQLIFNLPSIFSSLPQGLAYMEGSLASLFRSELPPDEYLMGEGLSPMLSRLMVKTGKIMQTPPLTSH